MKLHIAAYTVVAGALLLAAPQAFAAAGTAAGTKVHNSASVSYKVGGVSQTAPAPGTTSFLVDRKVDFTVTEVGGSATQATPGATSGASVVTKFQVVNNTNDAIDLKLDATTLAASTALGYGSLSTSKLGTMTYKLYRDDVAGGGNGDGVPDPAEELLSSSGQYYLDTLASNATASILVVADEIPALGGGVVDGDIYGVELTGTAASAYATPNGTAGLTWDVPTDTIPTWTAQTGVLGVDLDTVDSTSADADTANVDTILAESADTFPTGAAHDGVDAAYDAYELGAATIAVSKQSAVYWDPINLYNNPKAIPGAVVLYCITVENTGSAAASDIVVSDQIPTQTTFLQDVSTLTATGGLVGLSTSNSIRFSTDNDCSTAAWEAAGTAGGDAVEDSDSAAFDQADADTDGIFNDDDADFGSNTALTDPAEGKYGYYEGGATPKIRTQVSTLGIGSTTATYTTTMFLVQVN